MRSVLTNWAKLGFNRRIWVESKELDNLEEVPLRSKKTQQLCAAKLKLKGNRSQQIRLISRPPRAEIPTWLSFPRFQWGQEVLKSRAWTQTSCREDRQIGIWTIAYQWTHLESNATMEDWTMTFLTATSDCPPIKATSRHTMQRIDLCQRIRVSKCWRVPAETKARF